MKYNCYDIFLWHIPSMYLSIQPFPCDKDTYSFTGSALLLLLAVILVNQSRARARHHHYHYCCLLYYHYIK